MTDLVDYLPAEARKRLRRAPIPAWTSPMLATLTTSRFSDKAWIFERKLDGERGLAFKRGAHVRLLSRNQQELNNTSRDRRCASATARGLRDRRGDRGLPGAAHEL